MREMRENRRGVVREYSVQAGLQCNEGLREKSISAQFLVLNCYQRPKTACIGHCFQMYLLCISNLASEFPEFQAFSRFSQSPETGNRETGKPGNPHIKPNLCIRSLLTSYDMVKYNLIPPDKLMGVMVDVMIDKKGVISVQHGVVIEVLWDA